MKSKKMYYGCGCGLGYSFPTTTTTMNTARTQLSKQGVNKIAFLLCTAYAPFADDADFQDIATWQAAQTAGGLRLLDTCTENITIADNTTFEERGGCGARIRGVTDKTITLQDQTDNATFDRHAFYTSLQTNSNGFYIALQYCRPNGKGRITRFYPASINAQYTLVDGGVSQWDITINIQAEPTTPYLNLTWDMGDI